MISTSQAFRDGTVIANDPLDWWIFFAQYVIPGALLFLAVDVITSPTNNSENKDEF